MTTGLLIGILALDLILIGFLYLFTRRSEGRSETVGELAEERRILDEMRTSVKDQCLTAMKDVRSLTERVNVLVTEVEVEHEEIKKLLADGSSSVIKEIEGRLEEPLAFISDKCRLVEKAVQKVGTEKESLLRALKKAETITRFFDNKISYQDLIEEIEDKKYSDARHLLSKGLDPEAIASQLNLPVSEVKLLTSMT